MGRPRAATHHHKYTTARVHLTAAIPDAPANAGIYWTRSCLPATTRWRLSAVTMPYHRLAGTVEAVFELSSADSFHLVSRTSNFLWKSLSFRTPTGQTGQIDRRVQGGGHSQLVTCTYTGPASGNQHVVTGFLTP